MSMFTHIAKSNRLNNAGGCYPDAMAHATTFTILMIKLNKEDKKDRLAMTIIALFLWFTQQWASIKSYKDIPNFTRISGTFDCQPFTFRTFTRGNNCWAEYAHEIKDNQHTYYVWQPIPRYLNCIFQPYLGDQRYNVPFLNDRVKQRLFKLINSRWKTPLALKTFKPARKNTFYRYISLCARADETLTPIPRKHLVKSVKAHHTSAICYQRLSSDRLRFKIFDAHNRYIGFLFEFIRKENLHSYFKVHLKSKTVNLITERLRDTPYENIDPDLKHKGSMSQYKIIKTKGNSDHVAVSAIMLGSRRVPKDKDVTDFLNRIDSYVKQLKPTNRASRAQWLAYFNAVSFRIALLFIVLTGVRPTHSISLLSHYFSFTHITFVKDKGRLRQVILSDYLLREITHYTELKASLHSQLSLHDDLPELWYIYDKSETPTPLSARALRVFMNKHWAGVVPYQLRHYFAQCAHTIISLTPLTAQDIDRLMGHENTGEHLGSDIMFPKNIDVLKAYLNGLDQHIGVKELHYV
ncbi:hypothetical protein ACTXIM_16510 [Pseudoalteromonas nigrifaciens]|uniref:hypothetical protein n=1 Tax=Pseudoalteromonas nigrifaciens TaxID=28109 RepID=UPI003FD2C18E